MKTPAEMIETLTKIKMALLTSSAISDTVFMPGETNETACEAIDDLLASLGVDEDLLAEQYVEAMVG